MDVYTEDSIQDYMFEESVCLLLRGSWFKPLSVEEHVVHEDAYEELEEYYPYEDEEMEEAYYGGSSSVRIGNCRWGDNGYVRGGRQEARPVHRSNFQDSGASSSREPKKKDAGKGSTGRRAKRTQKREAADKAAEAKHGSFQAGRVEDALTKAKQWMPIQGRTIPQQWYKTKEALCR
ncbi:hypothetical protein ACSQ67_011515 [Phaseolus vulgaris]